MHTRNITLVGYRGTGKTKLGKKLAGELEINFIDIDFLIESDIGISIKDYFEKEGEKEFRKHESEMIEKVFEEADNTIISCGGGVILNKKNIINIKSNSKVVFLDVDKKTIFNRIKDSNRPSLLKLPLIDEINHTLKKRLPLYQECADVKVSLQDVSIIENVNYLLGIIKTLPDYFKPITIQTKSENLGNYEIIIERGVFKRIAQKVEIGNRYLIITDSNIKALYGDDLKKLFEKEGKKCSILCFPSGEENKNLQVFSDIHERINLSLDRKSCIIALGGGVTGDMAGFIASTYMRGIPFIQVPTSLLAMVDSSIGGKLGVNTLKGKNCVGVFNNPWRVYIDPLLLHTLPDFYVKDGLSEVIKHAIIQSKSYFDFILDNIEKILTFNTETLSKLIYESIKIKMSVVRKDEKELDHRRVLNFGHTVGHALEEVLGYGKISHGFAVSIGMVVASYISLIRGMINEHTFNDIKRAISLLGLPISLKDLGLIVDLDQVLNYLKHDKKTVSGNLTFVLINSIGNPVIKNDVMHQEILEAMNYVF